MKNLETTELPAVVGKQLATRTLIQQKLEVIAQKKAELSNLEKKLKEQMEEGDQVFLQLHKEHGDFEINGFTVKKRTSWATVVVDESKLPKDCITYKASVSLTKVKEHIMDGKLPKEVAFQQKNESINIK